MNRDIIRELGFEVKDTIDPDTFWEYCPICGSRDREDGHMCDSCKEALNREIGE